MRQYVWGALLTVLVCVIAAGLAVLQQRVSPSAKRARYNEVNGFVFAIVGVFYAVVVAFVVMDVWSKISTTRDETYQESTALVEMYWHTQYLPSADRDNARLLIRQYTSDVVAKDWPNMSQGRRPEPTGWVTLDQIRSTLERAASAAGPVGDQAEAAMAELQHVYEGRQARLSSQDRSVPAVMWFVLLAGGVLTIALAFMFGVPGRLAHAIMVVSLTAMVTMLLFAIYALQQPFDHDVGITPIAFEQAVERFDQLTSLPAAQSPR